ncbi:MAG: 30S ribosomal protein S16 [Candidatus Moranbacteria bacterium]|nr:30S ribosomal protein S16 [Candidatus Moranbacteria bacterium]
MLKIRLTRRGKKNKAFYRLVVAEHTAPIKGKFVEVLGFVNPHTKEKNLKEDRIKYWIGNGAQCSDSVHNLLVASEIVKGPKRAVKMKRKAEESKEAAEPAPKATPVVEVDGEKPAEEAKAEEPKAEEKKEEPEVEEKPEEKKD